MKYIPICSIAPGKEIDPVISNVYKTAVVLPDSNADSFAVYIREDDYKKFEEHHKVLNWITSNENK